MIEALLPVELPRLGVTLARGVRAGRWVFATGLSGASPGVGLSRQVTGGGHPLDGEPKAKREARALFANAAEVLAAGGVGFADCVRIDQYYTGAGVVDSYHEVRREVFAGTIPPSTSNLHVGFPYQDQAIEVQLMAAVPGDGFRAEHLAIQPGWAVHASSGYSPALAAGAFVFVPGQTAEARETALGPLDPEARMPAGHLWKGTPIKLETAFILQKKLVPSLAAVGLSLADVVKAQVYLRDAADLPAFNEVWRAAFARVPATIVIATDDPGFIVGESRIEINTISVRPGSPRADIEGPALCRGWPAAVGAGDLLFLSGLVAADADGLLDGVGPVSGAAFTSVPIMDEVAAIARRARDICAAAEADLSQLVRLQLFVMDLAELPLALKAWSTALGGAPLPVSAIEVRWLPVPGARVMADLWVHRPNG